MTRYARGYKKSYEEASSWDQLKHPTSRKHGTAITAQRSEPSQSPGISTNASDKVEKRREARRKRRLKAKACFGCRGHGHTLAECPEAQNKSSGGQICFSCGSTKHTLKNCKDKKSSATGDLPFAKCFVCGEDGHLSRQCSKNPNGLYPDGGGCKFCGSAMHLKKDCPDARKTIAATRSDKPSVTVSKRLSSAGSADSIELDEQPVCNTPKKKPKKKIVKF